MATTIQAKAAKKDAWYKTPKGMVVRRIGAGLTAQGNVRFEKEDGDEVKLPAALALAPHDDEETKPGKKKQKRPASDDGDEVDADDEMAEMRRQHEQLEKGGGGGGGDDLDQIENGDNERHILPIDGSKKFYEPCRAHYFRATDDDDDESTLIISRCPGSGKGRDLKPNGCEFCKDMIKHVLKCNKRYPRGSEDGREAYKRIMRKWAPQEKFLMGTYNAETDEVKALLAGPKVLNDMLSLFFDQKIGDFTDPETGRPVNIKRKKTGKSKRDVQYQVVPLDRAELPNAEDVLERRVDLKKLADALFPKYDAEEQRAFIEGKTLEDGDADSSSVEDADASSNDDGPPEQDDEVEPIAAEDARKNRWYQTAKGFVGQAKGRTPKGNYKFVASDGEEKLLTPTAQVTEVEEPGEDDGNYEEQEDE